MHVCAYMCCEHCALALTMLYSLGPPLPLSTLLSCTAPARSQQSKTFDVNQCSPSPLPYCLSPPPPCVLTHCSPSTWECMGASSLNQVALLQPLSPLPPPPSATIFPYSHIPWPPTPAPITPPHSSAPQQHPRPCHAPSSSEKKRKDYAVKPVKEKLMINLSFPLA